MKTTHFITVTALCALLTSCNKNEPTPFTPTDVTGTTVVKGNVNKNVITPDGSGGWTSGSAARIPAPNVNVSITVNKNSLYPNSSAQGADVYNAVTDASGNYSVAVRSNASGVIARITIDGFTGTLDTLVNGVTKNGLSAVYQGTTITTTLIMGQPQQVDHSFDSRNVASNPNAIQTGTAILTGSASINLIKETMTGTLVSYSSINAPVPAGHKVYLRLQNDPVSLSGKVYETTTDANGYYSFELSTVANGTQGFSQNATIWMNDYAATRDTLKADNTVAKGMPGVFQMNSTTESGLYNHTIRNAVYVRYNTFVPN